MEIGTAIMENSMTLPKKKKTKQTKKLKIELSYDPAIPLLGIYPKAKDWYLEEISTVPYSLQHWSQ